MSTKIKEFHRPVDWKNVAEILERPGMKAAPILVSAKPDPVDKWDIEAAVDLSLLGLNYVKEAEKGLWIGALTTLQAIVDEPIFASKFNGIFQLAAKHAATGGLRNVATIAGVLSHLAGSGEIVLALLVSDAIVSIRKDQSTRTLPIQDFLEGGKQMILPGEILSEVHIPYQEGAYSLERVARTPSDQEIVAVAVYLNLVDKLVDRVRIAVSGASSQPQRFIEVEQFLEKREISIALVDKAAEIAVKQATPVSDFRGSAEYRAAMAGTLTRRALLKAWGLIAG